MTAHIPCRACGASDLALVLDLGETPLANSLLTEDDLGQPEERFPLVLAFCNTCALVQITHSVPPEKMFREYLYFSSFSDTMVSHAKSIVSRLVATRALGPNSLVVEVASNDGYLLKHYRAVGVPVLGIEPARNVAKVAVEQHAIPTVTEFFDDDLAARLVAEGKRADVIHSNNVLAHVPDLNGFVAGVARLLTPGGVWVIEAPYVRDMIEHVEFDTIYHEHLCYFSATALSRLFARHGLKLVDVERVPIHGGSLRLFVSPVGSATPAASVAATLDAEARLGMASLAYYATFGRAVEELRTSLVGMLRELKASGKRIAAYGASAKGSTLLNTFGIGRETLDFAADRSTHKQGRYMPGVRIPIVPTERLLEAMPDYTLLLTWNFANEILSQQQAYRDAGGKFIVPVPAPRVMLGEPPGGAQTDADDVLTGELDRLRYVLDAADFGGDARNGKPESDADLCLRARHRSHVLRGLVNDAGVSRDDGAAEPPRGPRKASELADRAARRYDQVLAVDLRERQLARQVGATEPSERDIECLGGGGAVGQRLLRKMLGPSQARVLRDVLPCVLDRPVGLLRGRSLRALAGQKERVVDPHRALDHAAHGESEIVVWAQAVGPTAGALAKATEDVSPNDAVIGPREPFDRAAMTAALAMKFRRRVEGGSGTRSVVEKGVPLAADRRPAIANEAGPLDVESL